MLDKFLDELETLLTKQYGDDWTYDFDVDGTGVQIHLSVPAEFPEDGDNETNDYED